MRLTRIVPGLMVVACSAALVAQTAAPKTQAPTAAKPAAAASSGIPTPESVIGFEPGADFKLANYEQAIEYFTKVQAVAGGRMQMVTAGKTSEGRTYQFALISSRANLLNVDHYREIERRLAHPEGLTDADARALAKEGKVFFHVDGGLHATEVAGAQMTPKLLYDLLAKNDRGTDEFLNNVIVMLWPTINPDGMSMVANYAMAHDGKGSPPQLYQDYVGHDNNRDAYMLNMIESRVMEYTWRQWEPNIIYVFHQSPNPPARIWLPPFADPIPRNAPYRISSEVNMIGMAIGKGLDDRGQFGAIHGSTPDRFDAWYAGYVDYNPVLKNIPSFWTETAGNGAVPVPARPPTPEQMRPRPLYPTPYDGAEWHLRDAVAYDETAAISVIEWASKYKESVLMDRYLSGRDQIAAGRKTAPYAYVFPQDQADPVAVVELLRRLAFAGLRVSQLTAAATIDAVSYPAGTWIVPADQEFSALAREVLDPQDYPTILTTNNTIERPYDASGWTLPFTMGVKMARAAKPLGDDVRRSMKLLGPVPDPKLKPQPYNVANIADAAPFDSAPGVGFDANPAAAAIVPAHTPTSGSGAALAFDASQNNAYRAIYRAWKTGGAVRYVAGTTATGARYVVTGLAAAAQDELANTLALRAERVAATVGVEMKKPRVALYSSPSSQDDGWTRWVLDMYGIDYTAVAPADFPGTGALKDRFDVVILSSEGAGALGGTGRGGGGRGGGGRGAGAANAAPAGAPTAPDDRAKAVEEFVKAGGTLLCFNGSARSAVTALQLPVKIVQTGDMSQFFVGGSVLRVSVDTTQRVTAGMPADAAVFFDNGPIFQTGDGFKGVVLARYQDAGSPLMSGFLLGEKFFNGNVAALDVEDGAGHVILLGFRPQWRGQPFGDFKLIFNAMLEGK